MVPHSGPTADFVDPSRSSTASPRSATKTSSVVLSLYREPHIGTSADELDFGNDDLELSQLCKTFQSGRGYFALVLECKSDFKQKSASKRIFKTSKAVR